MSQRGGVGYLGAVQTPIRDFEELVASVSARAGMDAGECRRALAALGEELRESLRQHRWAMLPGFATVRLVEHQALPAREGINPFTKAPIVIAARPASLTVRSRPDPELQSHAERWRDDDALGPAYTPPEEADE